MRETSQRNRTIMSIIAILIGLLMAYLIPFIVQTSLERVLVDLMAHIDAGNPTFSSGLKLFDFFYPVWRAVIFVAGAALIIISGEIRKGSEWTYPLAMALFALPAIGGMFMFLPYISFVDGFPLPMTISWIGLAGYFSFIFLRDAERSVKWTRFGALTFLGMLCTHAFTIGVGAQRTMWTRPGHPLYPDFRWRDGRPALSAWFDEAVQRPSVQSHYLKDFVGDSSAEFCQAQVQAVLAAQKQHGTG